MTANISQPQSTDASSSSLGPTGKETPLHQPLSPPPLREVEKYEKRSLPPLPGKRQSGVSAFSKEVDEALATPDCGIFLSYRQFGSSATAWDDGEAEIAFTLDRQAATAAQMREILKLDTANLPRTPPDKVVSPQPRWSISKVQQMTGLGHVPGFSERSPSGHESEEKADRVVGLGLSPGVGAARYRQLHDDVSPRSDHSSVYSNRYLVVAISDLDVSTEANGRGYCYPSDPSSTYLGSKHPQRHSTGSPAISGPLRIMKSAMPTCGLENGSLELLRPDEDSHRLGGSQIPCSDCDLHSDKSSAELYHQAAKELAKGDTLAARHTAEGDRARQLPVHPLLERDLFGGVDKLCSSQSKQFASVPHCGRTQQYHPERHRDPYPSGSSERLHPTWRTPNFKPDSARAPSASTFGKSVYGSDGHHHSATVGTSETGGSISVSLTGAGWISPKRSSASPTSSGRPRSSSILTKVLRRTSKSPTTPAPAPSPPSPVPHPSLDFGQYPQHGHAHHLPASQAYLPAWGSAPAAVYQSPPSHPQSPAFLFPSPAHSRTPNTSPASTPATNTSPTSTPPSSSSRSSSTLDHRGRRRLKARASVSALAAKTADTVGEAAGLVRQTAVGSVTFLRGCGGEAAERRRERRERRRRQELKQSIRVVRGGNCYDDGVGIGAAEAEAEANWGFGGASAAGGAGALDGAGRSVDCGSSGRARSVPAPPAHRGSPWSPPRRGISPRSGPRPGPGVGIPRSDSPRRRSPRPKAEGRQYAASTAM